MLRKVPKKKTSIKTKSIDGGIIRCLRNARYLNKIAKMVLESGEKLGSSKIIDFPANYSVVLYYYAIEEVGKIEKKLRRDVLSPYEIPVEDYQFASENVSQQYSQEYGWMCDCLAEAKNIIKTHHNHPEYAPQFFDNARFELYLQLDMQYAYAYIQLTGGPVYPIHVHNSLKDKTPWNQRILVVSFVHELLHAIHPDWGHNKIRPAERRLANLGGYFDAYHEMEIKFLSGQMSLCNNTMTRREQKVRIQCPG